MPGQARIGAIDVASGELPTRFRILRKGENTTTKGPLYFGDAEAASVIADFEEHGVDMMIDLEHLSLDDDKPSYDPDARAWLDLAVIDGELWAENVRWTPDGVKRLMNRTQRYISPVVYHDDEGRVIALLNLALCAMPATDNAAPLIAASRLAQSGAVVLDLKVGAMIEKLKEILALLAEGKVAEIVPLVEALIAEYEGQSQGEPTDDPPGELSTEVAAALGELTVLTGVDSWGGIVTKVKELSAAAKSVADARQALELSERRGLICELITVRAESPATAWDGEPAERKPCARLSAEPIADLRTRVAALKKAAPKDPEPPAVSDDGISPTLAARLKRANISHDAYKATRAAVKRG